MKVMTSTSVMHPSKQFGMAVIAGEKIVVALIVEKKITWRRAVSGKICCVNDVHTIDMIDTFN
jgi:hypothetical protein